MWNCPECNRTFKRKEQQHGCQLINPEDLFLKRPAQYKVLYEQVIKIVTGFGDYRIEAVAPDVILFKTKSTFLGVKVKKDHLQIEFFLDHLEDQPPVCKFLQTSKHRVVHLVKIDEPEDLDQQLTQWMKASYDLIGKA